MVVMEVVCNLDTERNALDFFLQVAGTSEYLDPKSQLQDYEYVHQCYKYDKDLEFILVPEEDLQKPYLRTVRCFFYL
jgi:phosphatidylinositol-4-phosphate 3-kinase